VGPQSEAHSDFPNSFLELAVQTEASSGMSEEGRDPYFGGSSPLRFYAGVLRVRIENDELHGKGGEPVPGIIGIVVVVVIVIIVLVLLGVI
jgi:hypothetical protein